ncbi:MAG: acetyl/propionyl/methylcrotonyl-CoA carboxylase subunit alpha [Erythrobacter sp.]|jgi:3-methylcrotonyl-CoA carboxylase alpha subunit|uniref:acetyl/propionyl/methylcrotonyl-CoA carboxylase subunit alpha n=1 Tax=Qipengyuania citrea TaxID=225971 RepID=UPI001A59BB7A|nr:acetyl/propionyl/methylcrotonyl-CoA carboxylase subunit alpha [Qipengyuania citrea]MBL4718254.1 acetyl/propionyl/methylcrotonyl-CoA carboxylase subunit alpha [Erythrobacter sp.]MCP2017379.1 3-methylcrotonyl-CoA carboxylase alpha subunit [Qipengyuania citrea]MDE0901481.1 acetyl/propionyl/methylcrotonyl-CoA carboxylase subunit alpha [Erythrobacter sp.]
MIQKLLIANRGEIACRIIRTARAMGVATVAVYSDADARALHVRQADEAVHIGPSPAAESYLVGDKIIAAAKQTGADAIHPGYGFLSENAGFAQAVIDAGLIWVGPKPSSIEAMGLKDAAKTLMMEAGVPVTPGYLGTDQSAERLKKEADAIGYPVLIKAVAGGGGKGMRKVDKAEDFEADLQSCRREAKASFSNDEVLLEKWITSPRHIEVQVFGDSHGNVVHLFERDCSLQRRHQKVIEEAPAPGMDEATRQEICAAAVRAAKAVDYEGAGTIEFIADASEGLRADRIFFMEMNTRLQVEHPVTEEITGVDLVEWQLRVASGEPIPLKQEELRIDGHAIEARLYAEDPASGFLPSTGPLDHFDLGSAGRIETGVAEGDMISPHYDPMVAKLVVWEETRDRAIETLADIAESVEVWPVKTNAAFLANALLEDDFGEAELDTGFIERKLDRLVGDDAPDDAIWQAAADFTLLDALEETAPAAIGFRLNAAPRVATTLCYKGESRTIAVTGERDAAHATGFVEDARTVVFADGQSFEFALESRGSGAAAAGDGAILAPMPGKVIAVDVAAGDTVTAGQRLMVLEAMKMEHALTAPFDGTVTELAATEGGQVQVEAVLCVVEPAEE